MEKHEQRYDLPVAMRGPAVSCNNDKTANNLSATQEFITALAKPMSSDTPLWRILWRRRRFRIEADWLCCLIDEVKPSVMHLENLCMCVINQVADFVPHREQNSLNQQNLVLAL